MKYSHDVVYYNMLGVFDFWGEGFNIRGRGLSKQVHTGDGWGHIRLIGLGGPPPSNSDYNGE